MSIIERIKKIMGNKKTKEDYIQVLKDYVEGKMDITNI